MNPDIVKVLLDKQPTWFFHVSSVILTFILIVVAIWVFKGAKRYYLAVDKENRIVSLLEEKNALQQENKSHKAITEQMSVVLENSITFINALNNYDQSSSVFENIQSIIESLATDIKTVVGERHRCGFWLAESNNQFLKLYNGSASFPHGYIGFRELDMNNSIAGRCFRKKRTLLINDVTQDADWIVTDSPSSYSSLICMPVGSWGVITIDGKQKMNDNTVLIGKLYASIIEGFMNKFFIEEVTNLTQSEVAASQEEFEEGGVESENEQ